MFLHITEWFPCPIRMANRMPKMSIRCSPDKVQFIGNSSSGNHIEIPFIASLSLHIAKWFPGAIRMANRMPDISANERAADNMQFVGNRCSRHPAKDASIAGLSLYIAKRFPNAIRTANRMPDIAGAGTAHHMQFAGN